MYVSSQIQFIFEDALRDDTGKLIAYYEKHEYRDRETKKMYDLV